MSETSFHHLDVRHTYYLRHIRESSIPERNKELISGFDGLCAAQGLSLSRRCALLWRLHLVATRFLPVEFERATIEDIRQAVVRIEGSGLAAWTRYQLKGALRQFYRWVEWQDGALGRRDFPDRVAWIHPTIRRSERIRVTAGDVLTEEEVQRLIAAAANARDRAILSVTYELGARVGEAGMLQIRDVTRDRFGFTVDLTGKTGTRSCRVVMSAGALTEWLNLHPFRDQPESYLWIWPRKGSWQRLDYGTIREMLRKFARRAGIKKRIHPHLLRHSRITHLLANGVFTESQAKIYFGLVPDSRMLATYAHLVAKDANDAVLRAYGAASPEPEERKPPVIACGMCHQPNDRAGGFCFHCGYPLSAEAVRQEEKRVERAGALVEKFLEAPGVKELFERFLASLPTTPPAPEEGRPSPPAKPRAPGKPAAPRPSPSPAPGRRFASDPPDSRAA